MRKKTVEVLCLVLWFEMSKRCYLRNHSISSLSASQTYSCSCFWQRPACSNSDCDFSLPSLALALFLKIVLLLSTSWEFQIVKEKFLICGLFIKIFLEPSTSTQYHELLGDHNDSFTFNYFLYLAFLQHVQLNCYDKSN